jgi:uncharacterized damage-inducible protein DinB
MREVERITDQLRRSQEGAAWHGPSLAELLADVTSGEALARPLAGIHSIWEIVSHLAFWYDAARRRLTGALVLPSEQEQWPAVHDAGEAAWQDMRSLLETNYRVLAEAVSQLTDEQLTTPIAGKEYDVYFLLHGLIQHTLYHAGQIAVLKKAIRG